MRGQLTVAGWSCRSRRRWSQGAPTEGRGERRCPSASTPWREAPVPRGPQLKGGGRGDAGALQLYSVEGGTGPAGPQLKGGG